MEIDEFVCGQSIFHQLLPVVIGKHPRNEIFAQYGILNAPGFFHRQQRVSIGNHTGINAAAGLLLWMALLIVDLDTK